MLEKGCKLPNNTGSLFATTFLSTYYFIIYIPTVLIIVFTPLWLRQLGLTDHQITFYILSISCFRIVTIPLVGAVSGTPTREATAGIFLNAISALLFMVLFRIENSMAAIILFSIGYFLFSPTPAIGDRLSIRLVRSEKASFGFARCFGNISELIAAAAIGYVLTNTSIRYLPLFFAITTLLLVAALAVFHRWGKLGHETHRPRPIRPPMIPTLDLLLMVLISVSLATHSAYYAFSSLYFANFGFSAREIGLIYAAGIGSEIVFYMFSDYVRVLRNSIIIVFCVLLFTAIRWVLLSKSSEFESFMVVSAIFGMTPALCVIAMKTIVIRQKEMTVESFFVKLFWMVGYGLLPVILMLVISFVFREDHKTVLFSLSASIFLSALAVLSVAAIRARS